MSTAINEILKSPLIHTHNPTCSHLIFGTETGNIILEQYKTCVRYSLTFRNRHQLGLKIFKDDTNGTLKRKNSGGAIERLVSSAENVSFLLILVAHPNVQRL